MAVRACPPKPPSAHASRSSTTRQAAAYLRAVLAGQHQVQHDQVEVAAIQRLPHLRGIAHAAHLEALRLQVSLQQLAQPHVVVHQQHAGQGLVHAATIARRRDTRQTPFPAGL